MSDLGNVNNVVEMEKFLGVLIKTLLKWDTHIESVCASVRKDEFALRSLSNNVPIVVSVV